MRLVLRREGSTVLARAARATSPALVSAVLLLAVGAAAANASPASRASPAASSSFCGLAGGVAKTALDPSSGLNPTSQTTSIPALESKLKTDFETLEAAEPALISAAPSKIKGDLTQVFGVDNTLVQDLKNAHWNFLALAADAKTLEAQESKIKVPLAALEAYFKTTCGTKP